MTSPRHHNSYPTADERTAKAAAEARKSAILAAQGFLGRNAARLAVVHPSELPTIIRNEGERAAEEVQRMRSLQTTQSLGMGVSLYITPSAVVRLKIFASTTEGHQIGRYVNRIEPADSEGIHQLLDLPHGTYSMAPGGIQTYGMSVWRPGQPSPSEQTHPNGLAYDEVVRIEGYHNEVWQNNRFTPDGEPLRR